MKNLTFTREQVIKIIDGLLERPNLLIDAVQNEYTDYHAENLLEIIEQNDEL